MRPNLALGPIDGIVQYLVYVSIVVLGVLLPLLIQKWRQRRDNARVLEQTLGSLRRELEANLNRVRASRESMDALGGRIAGRVRALRAAVASRSRCGGRCGGGHASACRGWRREPGGPHPDGVGRGAVVAVVAPVATGTAQCLRASLQPAPGAPREPRLYLENALRSETLETPADLFNLRNVEMRLQMLAVTRAVVRYYGSLLATLITAYESALSESAASA